MSRAAKRSRLERIVRCALGWGFGCVLDDCRLRLPEWLSMSQMRWTDRLVATAKISGSQQARFWEVAEALPGKLTNLLEFRRAFPAEPGRSVAQLTDALTRSAASWERHGLRNSSCRCSSSEIVLAHLTPELSRTAARLGVVVQVTA